MVRIRIKPIRNWIGEKTKFRQNSRFELGYKDTLKLLDYELLKLNAIKDSIEIEMFIRPEDLRADGELRASARPFEPGVRLNFSIRKSGDVQTISYPCDTFGFWQDNLRAIAKSLENLRAVARYGVFKYQDMVSRLALPSADGKLSSTDEAARYIANYSNYSSEEILNNSGLLKPAFRQAAAKLHPDKNADEDKFIKLQDARYILEKHFENK